MDPNGEAMGKNQAQVIQFFPSKIPSQQTV